MIEEYFITFFQAWSIGLLLGITVSGALPTLWEVLRAAFWNDGAEDKLMFFLSWVVVLLAASIPFVHLF